MANLSRSWRSSIFFSLVLGLVCVQADAMDHRQQWGVGGSLGAGIAAPWSQREFESRVGAGPAGSLWARYVPGTPEVGVEVSYNYFQLSKMELRTHAFIVSFFSRQNPWGNFHPFYSLGVGWQTSQNFYNTEFESPIFKLQAGVEFEMNERTDIGVILNHYTIFQSGKAMGNVTDASPAHVLAPSVTFTYYFGTPAPMPVAPPPAPVATPAAAPTPAPAPAPAPAVEAETINPAPARPSRATKPAPAKKKPAPKKKRNR